MPSDTPQARGRWRVGRLFGASSGSRSHSSDDEKRGSTRPPLSKWNMGIMNDSETVEVPGSVLLLASDRNEPLGLRNVHARTSHSSIPAGFAVDIPTTPGGSRPAHSVFVPEHEVATPPPMPQTEAEEAEEKKRTQDGTIILEPQPDDSANDPLNWPGWRRDTALLSLGFYCMIGGGMTPVIAAGFTDVAKDYDVDIEKVALTTGLYMMGLGLGSVVVSPTAILYGKRPVYLVSAIVLIGTSLWAAWAPTFNSLLAARVFQGVAVSPVECLPSATVAEIFFLHERAFRIGIYTLLLLGGKNIVPLVSAAIIGRFGWRWTFWIVAMVVAFGGVLLFLFVPETFWDRTPTRKAPKRPSFFRRLSSRHGLHVHRPLPPTTPGDEADVPQSPGAAERHKDLHVGFTSAADVDRAQAEPSVARKSQEDASGITVPDATHDSQRHRHVGFGGSDTGPSQQHSLEHEGSHASSRITPATANEKRPPPIETPSNLTHTDGAHSPRSHVPGAPDHQNSNGQYDHGNAGDDAGSDYFGRPSNYDSESIRSRSSRMASNIKAYTHHLRQQPPQSFTQQLRPWNGRLNKDKWVKVMMRPFILYAYPAVLWSSLVYACSIGWLIVISETMAVIYRAPDEYNFTALQTGLVYISPFIGGILGTGVAGKVSDIIVRAMARRNGGMYEPEFRLIMAFPVLITTCVGLMGFGWSAQVKDHWIVPTVFFGVVSFGCSLGSTTSITFCVDSYRQYAGEALVTLNFTKNIAHGLVFSLFVSRWLEDDGPKLVYMWIGIIQLVVLLSTVPMYIFGKRARMWTVRKNLLEKF